MRVEKLSDTLYNVGSYSVKLQKKKGRVILLCSCTNSSRFADNNLCYHKELVLKEIFTGKIRDKLNILIKEYSAYNENKLKCSNEMFIEDLIKLKRLTIK